jgi:gliding motility-associated-like protein
MFSDSLSIKTKYKPSLTGIRDTFICRESPLVNMQYAQDPGNTYQWSDNSTGSTFVIKKSGVKSLKATNSCGDTTLYFTVRDTLCKCAIFVPNVFSPNGDGTNEDFYVRTGCDLSFYSLKIYNRWGELLFISNDQNEHWDGIYMGNVVEQDVYMYMLEFRSDVMGFSRWENHNGSIMVMH